MKNPFAPRKPNALKQTMDAQFMALPDNVKIGAWELIKAGALLEVRVRFDRDSRADTALWLIHGDQSVELSPFRGSLQHHGG